MLSSGDLPSGNGGQDSQVFIAQGDDTGNLAVLGNPLTVPGVGTALAAAQIDGVGGMDLFVGLQSGGIDPLFAAGSTFTVGATISAFNGVDAAHSVPVDGLDVISVHGGHHTAGIQQEHERQ